MKKLAIYIASLAVLTTSCDLKKTPFDSLTKEEINNIEGGIETLNLGNYHNLKGWVENWHRLTEYPGDNVSLSGTTTDNFFYSYNYQRLVNNSRANSLWNLSYKIIVGTNIVLEQIKPGESDKTDQIYAENLYIRSLMYFYLTNIFGKPYNQGASNLAVPIKLTSDIKENNPRSTVGEVYAQIEKDLLQAEALFKEDKKSIFATREAAQALLARLYLYKEDNAKAVIYADKVEKSGKFSLLPTADYKDFAVKTPENNPETIFSIKFVKDVDYKDNGWYTIGSMYANVQGSGWGEMYASRSYLEAVRKYPQDVRYSLIKPVVLDSKVWKAYYVNDNLKYENVTVTKVGDDYEYVDTDKSTKKLEKVSNGAGAYQYYITTAGKKRTVLIDNLLDDRNGYLKYYILKCSGQEGQAHLWSPTISRLSEIYLIRAEANAKLGKTQAALEDVNIIRKRAGIPTAGLYTAANLGSKSALDVVLEERQLELAWEGHRKFDIFRNGRTLDRTYPGTHYVNANSFLKVEANSKIIIDLIPEQQILLSNGVLVQNEL
ncbi:RagB/SusD family nutrient uptake outer membrane protein [Sphingobacteriaceae bacterium WQ 2009]|uniref:RagB/SusD family nutrient uptake outer membrane protein n=1 Tax=Rhinopithecimicrobium faecis TaxID=2820698 RepID=A0A8T4H5P4_9SPHI|nr:RagB/SusD family nutrient uptake outer membrane protein [Sphingobacteriaceae bacterium WQ 2009]